MHHSCILGIGHGAPGPPSIDPLHVLVMVHLARRLTYSFHDHPFKVSGRTFGPNSHLMMADPAHVTTLEASA